MAKKKGGNKGNAAPVKAGPTEEEMAAITAKMAALSTSEQEAGAAIAGLAAETPEARAEAAAKLAAVVKVHTLSPTLQPRLRCSHRALDQDSASAHSDTVTATTSATPPLHLSCL